MSARTLIPAAAGFNVLSIWQRDDVDEHDPVTARDVCASPIIGWLVDHERCTVKAVTPTHVEVGSAIQLPDGSVRIHAGEIFADRDAWLRFLTRAEARRAKAVAS
jgi:hypothetical protein